MNAAGSDAAPTHFAHGPGAAGAARSAVHDEAATLVAFSVGALHSGGAAAAHQGQRKHQCTRRPAKLNLPHYRNCMPALPPNQAYSICVSNAAVWDARVVRLPLTAAAATE